MQQLLNDFEFADLSQWQHQVLEDLGLKNIEQLIQIPLSNRIIQSSYSDISSNSQNQILRSYQYCTTNTGDNWQGARYWLTMDRFEGLPPSVINQQLLVALAGGADGIVITSGGLNHWEQLLAGVSLSDCYLGVEGTLQDILGLLEYLEPVRETQLGFFVIADLNEQLEQRNSDLIRLLNRDTGFRSLVLQVTKTKPGTLDELALLLCQGIYAINTLMEANIPLLTILKNIQFSLRIGDSYLWEICRLRCLRILFHQVVQQYGVLDYLPGSLVIQATTSDFQTPDINGSEPLSASQTTDKNTGNHQLLRNTTQTMAAVLGGCNIVSIVPHQHGFSSDDPWPRRIARNISHILREECHFHKMADPVAGSYYLEELTTKMLKDVWSRLQQLESSGGYLKHKPSRK